MILRSRVLLGMCVLIIKGVDRRLPLGLSYSVVCARVNGVKDIYLVMSFMIAALLAVCIFRLPLVVLFYSEYYSEHCINKKMLR